MSSEVPNEDKKDENDVPSENSTAAVIGIVFGTVIGSIALLAFFTRKSHKRQNSNFTNVFDD